MLLRTLGGLALAGDAFRRPKPLLLLAFLSIEGWKERRYLAELFWPGAADPRQSLSVALSQLRSGAPGAVEADRARVRSRVACDARDLLEARSRERWAEVVSLHAGPFLDGVSPTTGGMELEEWVFATRDYISVRVQEAYVAMAERLLAADDAKEAARLAERAYRMHAQNAGLADPWHRRLHGVLAATASPHAADVQREAESLGIELRSAPPGPPGGMQRSRRGPHGAPGPATGHDLPAAASPAVGRDGELRELAAILGRGFRLVTLAGLGGIGKTRLALELARREAAGERFARVSFLSVESVEQARDVPRQVASALQVPLGIGQAPVEALARAVGDEPWLLVLDNFDHLASGAPVVPELLSACPGLSIVVTSRQPLGLRDEVLFPVEGLAAPEHDGEPVERLVRADALKLFVQRAGHGTRRFRLTRENAPTVLAVCRRVGGSPLGIELAAGLARTLPVAEVLAGLEEGVDALVSRERDRPERHASMRSILEQTWRTLPPELRAALKHVSVFRGGFSRSAASAVGGVTIPVLAGLVERGLVRRVGDRFDLHPLVREHAAEKLAAFPERRTATQERHAQYVAEHVAFVAPGEPSDRPSMRVAADLDNVRKAWGWSCANGRVKLIERMAEAVFLYMHEAGMHGELERMIEAARRVTPADSFAAARLEGMRGRMRRWDDAEGYAIARRVLHAYRRFGDDEDLAAALQEAGVRAAYRFDHAAARAHYCEALELFRRTGNAVRIAACLGNLALLTVEPDEHRELLREACGRDRDVGDDAPPPTVHLRNLALTLAGGDGDFEGARRLLEEALELERMSGVNAIQQAAILMSSVRVLLDLAQPDGAQRARTEALELLEGQDHWKADAMRAHLRDAGVLLTLAADGLRAAAVEAEAHLAERDRHPRFCTSSMEVAFAAAIARGDAARAEDVLQRYAPLSREVFDSRGRLYWRASWHVLAAQAATASGDARDHLLESLDVVTRFRFVPRALDALVAAAPLLPDGRRAALVRLAAGHPRSSLLTRVRARMALGVDAGEPLADDAPHRADPPDGVLTAARGVAVELRGQGAV